MGGGVGYVLDMWQLKRDTVLDHDDDEKSEYDKMNWSDQTTQYVRAPKCLCNHSMLKLNIHGSE